MHISEKGRLAQRSQSAYLKNPLLPTIAKMVEEKEEGVEGEIGREREREAIFPTLRDRGEGN